MLIDKDISTFVDAGSESLRDYSFASNDLRAPASKPRLPGLLGVTESVAEKAPADDIDMPVRFRFNQTGNIFYATTNDELRDRTKELFGSVTVLFAAMTTALASKGKSLFDYKAWGELIRGSSYFVEVQKYNRELHISSGSLAINTQIVQQLIPGLKSGSSMEIAKGVLSAINTEFGWGTSKQTSEFGHLLFICEELFGSPSVTVRLFHSTMESYQQVSQSGCHKSVSQSLNQKQMADTFLFVDPDTIATFAGQFARVPEAYTNLIDRLAASIDPPKAKEPEKK